MLSNLLIFLNLLNFPNFPDIPIPLALTPQKKHPLTEVGGCCDIATWRLLCNLLEALHHNEHEEC